MSLLIFILFIGIFNKYSNGNSDLVTFPLNDIPIELKSVSCQGQNSSCPNSETCCQLESGQYGCCPISGAVCCNDHLHCCPKGYTCDVEHSRCQKESEKSLGVVCPGGQMTCADGETCFQLQSGDYGCCPLPDALLCNDSIHCCPDGYTCNIEENQCEKGVLIPWFTNKQATPLNLPSKLILSHSSSSSLSTIQCSDKKSVCSEDTTCCELKNSTYGCCPSHQASCCSDKIHCCEEGYSCDKSGSKCIRYLSLIPLTIFDEQICPDGITKCSTSSTCCSHKTNDKIIYSCCPYARGVCCGSSCCPNKYICNEDDLTCQLNAEISVKNETLNPCDVVHSKAPSPDDKACLCLPNQQSCPDGSCCPTGHCNPSGGCR